MAYKNIDTIKLHEAVYRFVALSRSCDSSKPCTNHELNNVVNNLAELFNTFIDELEN